MTGVKPLNILRILAIIFILLFWPISFYLKNTTTEVAFYFAPVPVIILSLILFMRDKAYWPAPLLFIGTLNPLLTLFPLLVSILNSIFLYRKKMSYLTVILAVIIFISAISKFKSESIFYFDHNDQQAVIRNIYLYPDIYSARLFQNKPGIYWNRFKFNFFALVDTNNYFFHFHPREITVTNQNLDKFPFLAILFLPVGFYFYRKNTNWKFIFTLLAAAIINLSLVRNFDKNDLILYLPLGLIIIGGVGQLAQLRPRLKIFCLGIFLVFSFIQIMHIIAGSLSG